MNNVLYVNKPRGMTSFDVCFKLRKVLNTKKIGHAGTLDPLAEGLLVLAVNKGESFLITIVNDIVVKEENNLEKIDLNKYSKIIINSKEYFEKTDFSEYEVIEIENGKNIKETAYELLKQYRKKVFETDGRMLEFFENNVDLVALGTIADIVPLINENRTLVQCGLSFLNKNCSKRLGLGYIVEEFLKNKKISAKTISWNIAPILNAAGRMGKASVAANLLLADDKYNANNFFVELKKLNNDRKELQTENIKEFNIL